MTAVVLPPARIDLVRERDRNVGQRFAQPPRELELVRRVEVREQERDRDAVDLLSRRCSISRSTSSSSTGRSSIAVGVDAAVDLEAVVPRGERPWLLPRREAVEIAAIRVLDEDHVAEAAVRDEGDPRASSLDQRVRGHRRAVDEKLESRTAGCPVFSITRRTARTGSCGRLEDFVDTKLAGVVVERHEVGERASDVDGDAVAHGPFPTWFANSYCERIRCPPSLQRSASGVNQTHVGGAPAFHQPPTQPDRRPYGSVSPSRLPPRRKSKSQPLSAWSTCPR